MLVVKDICIPGVRFGRTRSSGVAGGIFLRYRAERQWTYLSITPTTFTLEELWEKASGQEPHCGDPWERLGG